MMLSSIEAQDPSICLSPETLIAVTGDTNTPLSELTSLAKTYSLPLLDPKNISNSSPAYLLYKSIERLEIRSTTEKNAIFIDFLAGKHRHRRMQGGGKGQDIAKAIGLHKIKHPSVLDATAGLGGDSFTLATLGCSVTMLERQPCVQALLQDALMRALASKDQPVIDIVKRMQLLTRDAQDYLQALDKAHYPDVIYLDPMFPVRKKSALVKKEMQFFHHIVGDDEDSAALLSLSLSRAKKRIVVKRPRLAEALNKRVADFSITGKTTRYDVYLPKQ